MDDWIGLALALAGCLFGAGFVSTVETALLAVSETRVRTAIEGGVKGARQLQYWVDNPGLVLATLGWLRACLVIGAAFAAFLLLERAAVSVPTAVASIILGLVVLTLAYMVPRTLAKRFAFFWARATIRVVRWLTFVLLPVLWPLGAMVRWLSRLAGGDGSWSQAFWTAEEFRRLSTDARADALEQQNEQLLSSIIEFSDTIIREIMVPRTEMIAIAVTATTDEVRDTIVEAGHSRLPIYEDTVDNIVGVLHVKDLFPTVLGHEQKANGHDFDLQALARRTFYVPEVMKISELLREFQRRKTHMAIVVDEYGGTAGVVTLEDIIEEIVGEIQDEYDVEEKQFRITADDKIIADGRVSIWDLEEPLGVTFPDDAGYETLAGFLMHRAGYLPRPGTVITWGELRFTIKEANEKRIGMVEVERRSPEAQSAGA